MNRNQKKKIAALPARPFQKCGYSRGASAQSALSMFVSHLGYRQGLFPLAYASAFYLCMYHGVGTLKVRREELTGKHIEPRLLTLRAEASHKLGGKPRNAFVGSRFSPLWDYSLAGGWSSVQNRVRISQPSELSHHWISIRLVFLGT